MSPPTARYKHTEAILGNDLFHKVANARILVVGSVPF